MRHITGNNLVIDRYVIEAINFVTVRNCFGEFRLTTTKVTYGVSACTRKAQAWRRRRLLETVLDPATSQYIR